MVSQATDDDVEYDMEGGRTATATATASSAVAIHDKTDDAVVSDADFDNFLQFVNDEIDSPVPLTRVVVEGKGGPSSSHHRRGDDDVAIATAGKQRRNSSIFSGRAGHRLDFRNVLLTTRPTKKRPSRVILDSLASSFAPKSLTAVMGPSGSGKTSLLKILTGRVGSNSTGLSMSGEIRLDGKVVDPTDIVIRKKIAYVEQDVSIPATCTPREAIAFSARLRLDLSVTNDEINDIVNDILDNLGLSHVADTLIGGGPLMSGGLSGGEKKRVQCGVELVTRPSLVILDEPTSGLDSYSAQSLMDVLKRIADAGATVIVTIHQPPPPVVRKIDNLLLLLGGRILYDGRMGHDLEDTFKGRGYPKPDDYNISDWILQVAQTNTIDELEGSGFLARDGGGMGRLEEKTSMLDDTYRTNETIVVASTAEHVGLALQTRLLFDRAFKQLLRDKLSFVIRIVVNLAFGLLYGCIFLNVGRSNYDYYPEVMASFGAQSNILIGTMFGVAQSSLMEFPKDRPVFLREYSTDHYSVLPYFLSKFSLECITAFIQVLSQMVASYFLMGFKANFFQFLFMNFLLAIASSSIGLFIGSCIEDPSVAAELMPALLVPQFLFSGVFIQVNLIPEFLRWAQYLCSLTYATRAVSLFEFGDCDTESCQQLLNANGAYEFETYWYTIILCAIAIVFRGTSMYILKMKASF
jgi:ABC-type multidrug transport system ATPase subunit/ABC-type multidrug transport system permease subunit